MKPTFSAVSLTALLPPLGRFRGLGDVNGDGKLDLIATTEADASIGTAVSTLSVLLGNGNGTYRAAVNYEVNGAGSLVVGDVNGDGKADLVISAPDRPITVFNRGDGTFDVPASLTQPGIAGAHIQLSDINGDGRLDVLRRATDGLDIFLNTAGGVFAASTHYVDPFRNGMIVLSLATGDLDGDGLPDLVVSADARTPLALYRNIGGGVFGLPTPIAVSNNGPLMEWVAVADLNGDQRADIVGAGAPTTAVATFLNTGEGFTEVGWSTATVHIAARVGGLLGDFNGDGALDVAIPGTFDGLQGIGGSLLVNRGDGSLVADFGSLPNAPIAVGDLNGDGKLDLLATDAILLNGSP